MTRSGHRAVTMSIILWLGVWCRGEWQGQLRHIQAWGTRRGHETDRWRPLIPPWGSRPEDRPHAMRQRQQDGERQRRKKAKRGTLASHEMWIKVPASPRHPSIQPAEADREGDCLCDDDNTSHSWKNAGRWAARTQLVLQSHFILRVPEREGNPESFSTGDRSGEITRRYHCNFDTKCYK